MHLGFHGVGTPPFTQLSVKVAKDVARLNQLRLSS